MSVIRKTVRFLPPRKGGILVDVICGEDRIALIRFLPAGPVLWQKSGRAPGPDRSTLVADLKRDDELWCPKCGLVSFDARGLQTAVAEALRTRRRVKFFV